MRKFVTQHSVMELSLMKMMLDDMSQNGRHNIRQPLMKQDRHLSFMLNKNCVCQKC